MIEFNTDLQGWEHEIVQKYPLVYLEPNLELLDFYPQDLFDALIKHPNFCNLRYGFECGSGWAKLIDCFSNSAQELVKLLRSTIQPDAYIKAFIAKEKMGRFTWQGSNNLIEPFKTIWRAYESNVEDKSTTICEITGEQGFYCIRRGWMKTVNYALGKKEGYQPVKLGDLETWGYIEQGEKDEKR